jgi:Ca2+:H+ antiporter
MVVARRYRLLAGAAVAALLLATAAHLVLGAVAGAIASIPALVLVGPLVADGTDELRGRLSTGIVGIVQPAFGNVAELAITLVALAHGLPELARVAIAGSLLSNGILVAGIAGLSRLVAARSLRQGVLEFEPRLFTGLATLSVIAVVPIALLSFWTGNDLTNADRANVSFAAGVVLVLLGALYMAAHVAVGAEAGPSEPEAGGSGRLAAVLLTVGAVTAAVGSEWFVDGFQPAAAAVGIPAIFAALVIVPLIGNIGESYAAVRLAAAAEGDAAMGVLMNSVMQVATVMTGVLVVASRFMRQPLTLTFDPLVALALLLSLIVLWMIVHDGAVRPTEAVGLISLYAIVAAAVWVEAV